MVVPVVMMVVTAEKIDASLLWKKYRLFVTGYSTDILQ